MRFIIVALFALLPMTAMAGDRVTGADIDDVYEYVDAALVGNSCSAKSKDGGESCEVECPTHERAECRGTKTSANCLCLPASKPPVVREGLEAY